MTDDDRRDVRSARRWALAALVSVLVSEASLGMALYSIGRRMDTQQAQIEAIVGLLEQHVAKGR